MRYAPASTSPILDAGDPLDDDSVGRRTDIGAIDLAGHDADRFGRFGDVIFRSRALPCAVAWIFQVPTHYFLARCGSSDSEELAQYSHSALSNMAFPLHPTRSAFFTVISELNTAPTISICQRLT